MSKKNARTLGKRYVGVRRGAEKRCRDALGDFKYHEGL
jgi:hypothetical protein